MGKRAVAIIVSLWVIPISILVNRIVPDPYMDEIFHVPQAQRYCRGDFKTWDPMITTPPGLYYISLAYVASLFPGMWFAKAVRSFPEMCSTGYLRSTNALLAIVCSVLVYDILITLRPSLGERKATAYSVLIALYPLHWFFTFLYYTDVASVTAVLAMYLASLKKRYWASAMLGALATLTRQTNVIWMLFVAADGAIRFSDELYSKDHVKMHNDKKKLREDDVVIDNSSGSTAPSLRRRGTSTSRTVVTNSNSVATKTGCHAQGFICEVLDIGVKLWDLKWKVLVSFAPFLIVLIAFVTFVIWNGSIVLGAKEAHTVSPHVAQMMYFALVTAAVLAPVHFGPEQVAFLCRSFWKNKVSSSLLLLVSLIIGFSVVHLFSIAHPYLLADNRHYTFYIWRKIINTHRTAKYLLVPIYIYSWISIITILGKYQKKITVLMFIAVTGMVLIPAPLIEFRYYTIPFFFLIFLSQIEFDMRLFLVGALYVAVNTFTMAMFLYKPFHWNHERGTQRFIW